MVALDPVRTVPAVLVYKMYFTPQQGNMVSVGAFSIKPQDKPRVDLGWLGVSHPLSPTNL